MFIKREEDRPWDDKSGFTLIHTSINWTAVIGFSAGLILSVVLFFYYLKSSDFNGESILNNLITVNSIFSAVLATYLFFQIDSEKDKKTLVYQECIEISQKIVDFRRILFELTRQSGVWDNEKSTIKLFNLDEFKRYYFEYLNIETDEKKAMTSRLKTHEDFKENISTLYLAMISLSNTRSADPIRTSHLFNEFPTRFIPHENWVRSISNSEIISFIWFSLKEDKQNSIIQYSKLNQDSKSKILNAAKRINPQFNGRKIDNSLIADIASEIDQHYMGELENRLEYFRKGTSSQTTYIVFMTLFSLFLGVLFPFIVSTLAIPQTKILTILLTSLNVLIFTFFFCILSQLLLEGLKIKREY